MREADSRDFLRGCLWLEGAPWQPSPQLTGQLQADVAIIGGGFAGLWTALRLREAEPGISIVVLEAEAVGAGASGRNGGQVLGGWAERIEHLVSAVGREAALADREARRHAVDAIGQFVRDHSIECGFEKNGLLVVSVAPWQDRLVEGAVGAAERIAIEPPRLLSKEELRSLINSPTYRVAAEEPQAAIVDPARLVMGLARVAREQGVQIFERARVRKIRPVKGGVVVEAGEGAVRAEKAVVGTNAFSGWLSPLRRYVLPLYTYMLATEPLTEEQWSRVGWQGRHCVVDRYMDVHHYRPTVDGRITWGGESLAYHYGNGVSPSFERNQSAFAALRRDFYRTFPQLQDVRFTHSWGGPYARTVTEETAYGSLLGGRVHYGIGFNGHGVADTYITGGILRDFVLERRTELTDLHYVREGAVQFPPEPLRWLVVKAVARSIKQNDKDGRIRTPLLMRLAQRRIPPRWQRSLSQAATQNGSS